MPYTSTYKGSVVDSKLDAIKSGGSINQILTKQSNSDYDTNWLDVNSNGLITFIPTAAAGVPNLTMFVDSADNVLKYKDNTGAVYTVILG